MAGPIGTKLCWIWKWTQVEKHWPQWEHFNPELGRGNIWGFRGSTFYQKSGYDLQKKMQSLSTIQAQHVTHS